MDKLDRKGDRQTGNMVTGRKIYQDRWTDRQMDKQVNTWMDI